MNEKSLKKWFEEKSERLKWKIHTMTEWCNENREVLIVFGPVLFGSIMEIVKVSIRYKTGRDEKRLKDRYIYDRSNGHYYELKRKPKNSEWLQIEQRKLNGESIGWILNDMHLLK